MAQDFDHMRLPRLPNSFVCPLILQEIRTRPSIWQIVAKVVDVETLVRSSDVESSPHAGLTACKGLFCFCTSQLSPAWLLVYT